MTPGMEYLFKNDTDFDNYRKCADHVKIGDRVSFDIVKTWEVSVKMDILRLEDPFDVVGFSTLGRSWGSDSIAHSCVIGVKSSEHDPIVFWEPLFKDRETMCRQNYIDACHPDFDQYCRFRILDLPYHRILRVWKKGL